MLIESITCPECGEDATTGVHQMGCGKKEVMNIYCDFVEELINYPDHLLTKLSTLIYAEQMERQIKKKRYEDL